MPHGFQVGVIEVFRRRVLRRSWGKKERVFQIENSTCRSLGRETKALVEWRDLQVFQWG